MALGLVLTCREYLWGKPAVEEMACDISRDLRVGDALEKRTTDLDEGFGNSITMAVS